MTEDYDKAWRHPEFAFFFGNYCGLCLNRALSLEDLWHHFEEYHPLMLPSAIAHLDRVLANRNACCSACETLSHQAHRSTPRCPFAVNSILCQILRHGMEPGIQRDRSPRRAARRVHAPGSMDRGPALSAGGTTGGTQETPGDRGSRSTGPRRSETAVHPDGAVVVAARGLSQRLVPRPQLGGVHRQACEWNTASTDVHHPRLAHPPTEGRSAASSPSSTERHLVPGDARSPSELGAIQTGGQSLAGSGEEPPDHRGSHGPLPTVESATEALGTFVFSPSFTPRDSTGARADGHPEQTCRSDSEVACHAEHQQGDGQNHPLEVAAQSSSWINHDEPSRPPPEQCSVADHPLQDTAMESAEVDPGSTNPPRFAGGLPRSAIQSALVGLRLHNNANECWLNATVHAWLWTTSTCVELQWADFGRHEIRVGQLLSSPQAGGVSLHAFGFNPNFRGQAQQQDSGEFAASLLGQLNSPRFKQAWESRVLTSLQSW